MLRPASDNAIRQDRPSERPLRRQILRWLWIVAAVCVLVPPLLLSIHRFVPVGATPLMVLRTAMGYGWDHRWVPLSSIAPALGRSVVAAEDNLFCTHFGFDLSALMNAYTAWTKGDARRGGSTISQQTAKNLLLPPTRLVLRKGAEAYITLWMEALWDKQRILEVYLNIVEWGPGLYGAEAAAHRLFRVPAAKLSSRQSALLAAILPSPLRWSANKPGPTVSRRATLLQGRARGLDAYGKCLPE